jgi:hypothetical protein
MQSSGTTSNVTYPSERCHPAHSQDVLIRVDALARYLCWNKYDPTGDGKRARNCWAKAYDRFSRMQRSPHWWKLSCPRQFAIANPTGEVTSNYKDPEPFGSPLTKEPIDIEEIRAELKTQIGQTSLSPRDIRLIKGALKRSHEGSPFDNKLIVLWVALYEDYTALKRIANGNLKDHGWEYSSADEFKHSDAQLSLSCGIDEKTVAAVRKGMYFMLRRRKGAPSKSDPQASFRAIGIEAESDQAVKDAA